MSLRIGSLSSACVQTQATITSPIRRITPREGFEKKTYPRDCWASVHYRKRIASRSPTPSDDCSGALSASLQVSGADSGCRAKSAAPGTTVAVSIVWSPRARPSVATSRGSVRRHAHQRQNVSDSVTVPIELCQPIRLIVNTELRGTRCYVAWRAAPTGPLFSLRSRAPIRSRVSSARTLLQGSGDLDES